jgi:hypothetical protein
VILGTLFSKKGFKSLSEQIHILQLTPVLRRSTSTPNEEDDLPGSYEKVAMGPPVTGITLLFYNYDYICVHNSDYVLLLLCS